MKALIKDLATIALIGDGVAGLISPKKHCSNWEIGPMPFRKIIHSLVEHANITRALAAVEAGFGVWLIVKER